MNKRLQNILIIVPLLLVIVCYLLLQPRVSNLFSFIRTARLSAFIKNTLQNNSISAREFWQLREFYSPGEIYLINRNVKFTSAHIASTETLIDNKTKLDSLMPDLSSWDTLFKKNNERIVTNGKETRIYFIKPVEEMKTANGFFDYKDKDKKLLENKNWYVATRIVE